MGDVTKIEWCDHTFNPWEGCVKVSEECDFCYAAERDIRYHAGENWGKDGFRLFHVDSYWKMPLKWNREAIASGERRRVFCGSLCDVMEDREDLKLLRSRLFALIEQTTNLDWLLLTKRPQNFRRLLPLSWLKIPQANVWLGTTVGVNKSLWRVDEIKGTPAVIRFLSIEPLLEKLADLDHHLSGIDWAIFGGESGPNARPLDIGWIRSGIESCARTMTTPFVKQLGAHPVGSGDAPSRGGVFAGARTIEPKYDLLLNDKKGGNIAEFPEDMRIREFPPGCNLRLTRAQCQHGKQA